MAISREMIEFFSVLAAAHPERDLAPETKRIYSELLADIPHPLLMAAAKRCLKNCTFFPKIAELRQAASAIAREHREATSVQRLRESRGEMLPKPEAARFMTLLKAKATEAGNKAALVPFRRPLEQARAAPDFVVGEMSEEQWEARKEERKRGLKTTKIAAPTRQTYVAGWAVVFCRLAATYTKQYS